MSKKLKILIICSRNKKRSLTAEKIYRNDQRLEIRSAGTSPKAKRKITQSDLEWADLCLCMESKHQEIIKKLFPDNNFPTTLVLDIEDDYEFMDPELIQILENEIEGALHPT